MADKIDVTKILDVLTLLFGLYFLAAFGLFIINDALLDINMMYAQPTAILVMTGVITAYTFGTRSLIAQRKEDPDYEKISKKYFFSWLVITIFLINFCMLFVVFPIPHT